MHFTNKQISFDYIFVLWSLVFLINPLKNSNLLPFLCLVRTLCLIIDIETISKDLKVSQSINRLLVLLWFMNSTLMCLLWNLMNQSLFSSLASKLQALEIEVFLLSYFKKRNRERLKSSTIFKASRQDIILSFWSLA